jgi:SAM-dependent methyltransferase
VQGANSVMTFGDDQSIYMSAREAQRSRSCEVPAPYDAIALDYTNMDVIFKQGVIGPSLLEALGNLEGQTVIDWACGSGDFSTLPLVTKGHAQSVLGIDRSPEMIKQARAQSVAYPQVRYLVGDAVNMDVAKIEPTSIASSVFLLNYAEDRRQLRGMYATVVACLTKGGRFLAVVPNPLTADVETPQYGMCARTARGADGLPFDGALRTATLFPVGKEPFSFKTHWFSAQTYINEAKMAGLKMTRIVPASPSDDAVRELGAEFFRAYETPYPQHLIFQFRRC